MLYTKFKYGTFSCRSSAVVFGIVLRKFEQVYIYVVAVKPRYFNMKIFWPVRFKLFQGYRKHFMFLC